MRKPIVLLFTAFICYSLSSCNTSNPNKAYNQKTENSTFDKQWAKSFIDSVNTKFTEQIAAGDSSALASHYWPDAEILLDNSEPIKGGGIQSAWASFIRSGVKEMTFVTTDIKGDATFIIETGVTELKDGNKKLMDKAKYVVVWEKRNDKWKLYRDIGCTSLPAAK